ncbi:MAG: hypothetical protein EOP09_03600, partial [Proteobacteria bacterium]
MLVAVLLALCAASSSSQAALVSQYQFSNADVLPKNLWVFGFSYSQSNNRGSLNANGTSVSNTDFFSETLNYGHLLDEIHSPLEKSLASAAFDAYGRGTNDLAGSVVNQ